MLKTLTSAWCWFITQCNGVDLNNAKKRRKLWEEMSIM